MKPVRALLAFAVLVLPRVAAAVTLIGTQPSMSIDTIILRIETDPFSVTTIGMAGAPSLSGLAFQPGTGELFASAGVAGSGNVYTVDPETGVATFVGASGFTKVPGLIFDADGTLYGSADVTGNRDAADGLIAIEPVSGVGTLIGAYGAYVGVEDATIGGIDSLAIHPDTGVLYGMGGYHDSNGDFFGGDSLFQIDKQSGAATEIALLGFDAATIVGLSFDTNGRLYTSSGAKDGRIGEIDLAGPSFVFLGDATEDGSVSDIALPEPTGATLVAVASLAIGANARRRSLRLAGSGRTS